jgi:OOP family OmpA-OmpF porin
MISTKTLQRTVLSLSASLLLLNTVQAQEIDNRANVYGGLGYYSFDKAWDLDDDNGWIVGAELPVAEKWGVTVEHMDLETQHETLPVDADMFYTRLGGNYHLSPMNKWQPYVGVGIGRHRLDLVPGANDTNTAVDLGIGVKRFFSNNMFLRSDVKLIKVTNVSNLDLAVNVGIGYAFGGKKAAPVVAAPAQPAEADTDGDGVFDSRDKCANTPRELAVDADGCPILESSMKSQQLMVNFDFDKADVKPEYNDEIAAFAQFMTTYANTSVVIEGHTDSDGTEAYNQGLSERRATAVMNSLVEAGIAASRLSAKGLGEQRPLVDNDTAANKAQNRRIMAEVSVEVKEERRR